MRILIAEDDLTTRNMLTVILQRAGHEPVVTEDGGQAWSEMQKSDAPGMALLDWMLPIMDGVEVVRRVRALDQTPRPYLIILTTKSDCADLVEGLNAGADDYVSKPFHLAELRARIDVGRRILDMQARLTKQVRELREALAHLKILQGIIPICAWRHKVRDDKGYWGLADLAAPDTPVVEEHLADHILEVYHVMKAPGTWAAEPAYESRWGMC